MSQRRFLTFAALLLAPLHFASSARAGGFELAEQSASTAGTASAATARKDDPSLAWFNPAALADGKGFRISVGATLVLPSLQAEAEDGTWSAESDISPAPAPYAYASFARDEWAFGLSANVAHASNIRWPANWTARFDILESKPQFFRLAGFFAWSFGDIRIAAGPHLDMGTFDVRRGLHFVDDEGSIRARFFGAGVGAHGAVHYSPMKSLDLGLVYRSRTVISMDGDADFTTPAAFSSTAPDQTASTEFTVPDKFTLGAQYTIDQLALLLDLSYTLWSINERLVIDFENADTPDRVQINDWSNTLTVRLGAEYEILPQWLARVGGFYDMSPIPEDRLAPSAPGSDRAGFTVGSGVRFGDFGLDAFYGLTMLTGATSTSADAPLATYDGTLHLMGLSASYAPR